MAGQALAPDSLLQDTYRIVRRIGRGGMGEVYEATHARLSGRYAVKLLLEDVAGNEEAFARFRREAEVTSGLRHPNIVQVVDFNRTADGVPYLVMEFLDGSELSRELAPGKPLPLERVARILRQTVSALTAAHNRGIVHRDLKPENLFLARVEGEDEELVKILDFGISKVKEATTNLTRESAVIGTAHYMSPEQALGLVSEIDARSDQFALGSIVYEMLAGRSPFWGDSVPAVVYQVVHFEPEPLEIRNPAVSPELAAVVKRAMAKKPDERFANVREFHQAFVAAAGLGEPRLTPLAAVEEPAPAASSPARSSAISPWPPAPAPSRTVTENLSAGLPEPTARVGVPRTAMAIGLIALLGVGAAVGLSLRSSGKEPAQAVAPISAPAVPAPVLPAPTPAPSAPSASPAPEGPSSTVTVQMEGLPPGAAVTVDGQPATLPLRLPRGNTTHRVRVSAPGYEPLEQTIRAGEDQTVTVSLKKPRARRPRGETPAPAPRPGGDGILLEL